MLAIGSKEFKSQDAAIKYTRGLAEKYGAFSVIKEGDDFEYLKALIERHPGKDEKVGSGISAFKIIKNCAGLLAFDLIRVDGSEEAFSFYTCVRRNRKPARAYLTQAMRQSVSGFIESFKEQRALAFKDNNPWADGENHFRCESCEKVTETSTDAHVDHVIEFRKLRDAFVEGRSDVPGSFEKNYHHPCTFKEEDGEFEMEWVKFHNENCQLRILCADCNSKRLTKNLEFKPIGGVR